MRSRRTCARSYWACCTSQPCPAPPKTLDSLTAISGDIPRFPLTSSESVLRLTPRASAASVMVKPKGSIHSFKTTRPGSSTPFNAPFPCRVEINPGYGGILGGQGIVGIVATNPEPQVSVRPFDCKSAIVQRDAGGPDFLTVALSQLLELQGGVLLAGSQQ